MSQRLKKYGRYPKGPAVEQTPTMNTQFPPLAPTTTSQMPYYDPTVQPQTGGQNAWSQPLYATPNTYQQNHATHQPNYTNPNTYQHNQSSHQPVSESGGYWSVAQTHSAPAQGQWNEPWDYKSENAADNRTFTNYQQPESAPSTAQWQQIPYSQIDNQNYPQQQSTSYNQATMQEYQYQQVNNNTNLPAANTSLPGWENGSLSVTQPEPLPWTYSAPQYSDPAPIPVSDFSQNFKVATPWPSNSEMGDSNAGYSVSDAASTNYLIPKTDGVIIDSNNSHRSQNVTPQIDQNQDLKANFSSDLKSGNNAIILESDSTIKEQQPTDADYSSSTLSAFFQDVDQNELGSSSDKDISTTPTFQTGGEITSQEENITPVPFPENETHQNFSPSSNHDEEANNDESESNFVQKEKVIDANIEGKQNVTTVSPAGFNEEPVNQEVPEPPQIEVANSKSQLKQDNKEISEEPPNQQIPAVSDKTSRSTSAERERLVIRPREESPFKPPRSNSSKGIVVQQEISVQSHPESKHTEGKTVVQEVNLETFPDNLERPSDYEELRKQSPLYVSHKHLRSELNSSPTSLLCGNPDIPCVTLVPAAPPLSSSKSDKSESSNDSRAESVSLGNSNVSNFALNESNSDNSIHDTHRMGNYEKSNSRKSSGKETNSGHLSATREFINSSTSESKKYENKSSKSDKKENFSVEKDELHPPLYLKDSKINGSSSAKNKDSESLQHYGSNNELSNTSQRDSRRDNYHSDERLDSRYNRDRLEDNRHKFADQKYPSYDEREYYAERERSRPSSRTSLRERSADYPFQPRHDDYSYPPSRGDPRRYPPEYPRPPSRMSETDVSHSDRQQGYHRQPYQYPANNYPRSSDYYHRPPNQRGYEYDPYQRDPYYSSYYDAYRYAYSNFNYGYYDEIYRNDPRYQQYQEQYRQYYARYGYDIDYDRSSGHSGRSSVNELSKEGTTSSNYPEQDIDSNSEFSAYNQEQSSYDNSQNEVSNIEAILDQASSTPSSRLTPVKFSYAHPIARFSPGGLLITAIPSQISTLPAMPIRIHNIQAIREEEDSFQELKNYQGPLIRGTTHKNDVIEFCTQKIKSVKSAEDIVDRDSCILLWELMVLLLRQNGSVAGSDIAELLLKDHEVLRPPTLALKHTVETPQEHSPADVNDSSSQSHAGDTSSPDEGIVVLHDKTILNASRTVDVDKVTRKFREFLLFGHKKDALEWAMKHGLWGHALFLASKMDVRTYANVMTRFANSLALNDPLQTLYQLMSGRQPIAVTNVADKRWGDWRPHLAMILSNPSAHPDVDSRSITTLGDTLASRGCLSAAHFCYLMAQVEFGTFEQKNSKLVLLAADHTLPFEEFATNEAIQVTEIYEYAQSLANPNYMLLHLQWYKFLYAMRLVEHGFYEEALHYCEIVVNQMQEHPHLFQLEFISNIFKLATVLKYHDPHFLRGDGEFEDQDDPAWLKNLASLAQNFNNFTSGDQSQTFFEQQPEVNQLQNATVSQFSLQSTENVPFQNVPSSSSTTTTQNEMNNLYLNNYQQNAWNQQNNLMNSSFSPNNSHQDNIGYYQGDLVSNQGNYHRQSSIPSHEENETTDVPSSPVTQTPPFDYYSGGNQQVHESKPLYDTSNTYNNTTTRRERRDSALSSGSRYSSGSLSIANKSTSKEGQKSDVKKDKQTSQAGKTWLGGIFSRLLPKGPNQMILPDDKNPTIVWDEVKNCWVNKDSNDEDESNAPAAPPTDMELMGSKSSTKTFQTPGTSVLPNNNSVPPISSLPVNKFQRPKTRGMRQNYVDVLGNSGATKKTNALPEGLFSSPYDNVSSPQQMFMPSSTSTTTEDNSAEIDNSQSAFNSTLYEAGEPSGTHSTPLMFDPSEFDARRSSVSNQRHTLGRPGRRTYPT